DVCSSDLNMMLQVLDDGRLTDSLGHVVDFKNTILIMTSNLGTSLIGKRVSPGFLQETDESTYEKMKERVLEEMKRAFRPEFLNRIDDIIVFHALSLEHIKEIIRLMIGRINKQLSEKGIELVLTPAGRLGLAFVIVLTAGLLIASTARAQQSQPPPILIRDIHVEGNRRVQDAVILGRVKSTVGSTFNPSLLAEDIRSIFSLGFFD